MTELRFVDTNFFCMHMIVTQAADMSALNS